MNEKDDPHLVLVVPGRPTSWKRAEPGKRATRHTVGAMRLAAQKWRIVARDALPPGWPMLGRFRVEVEAHYSGGHEEAHEWHRGPAAEADWDNLGKLPSDALEGVLWRDDRQIVDGRTIKRYAQPQEQVVVRVWVTS